MVEKRSLSDEDISTTWIRGAATNAGLQTDPDTTDPDGTDTDGTDGGSGDADTTDS